jgi:hypothetical protein
MEHNEKETVRIHLIEQLPSLHMSNGTVKDPETLANAFNNFLLTITENSKLYKLGTQNAISFLKTFCVKFPRNKIIPTTGTEIKIYTFPGIKVIIK